MVLVHEEADRAVGRDSRPGLDVWKCVHAETVSDEGVISDR